MRACARGERKKRFFVFVMLGIKIIADSKHAQCKESTPKAKLSLKVLFFIAFFS